MRNDKTLNQKILGLSPLSLVIFLVLFMVNALSMGDRPSINYDDDYTYCTDLPEITVTAAHPYSLPHFVAKKGNSAERDSLIRLYKPAFEYFASKNNYNPEDIATLFIYESGGYNSLWSKGMNPFSIKAPVLDKDGIMYVKDDCGDVPCAFATYNSIADAFDSLEGLLERVYPNAKGLSSKEFFIYLKKMNYHSDSSQYNRIALAKQYKNKYFNEC